MNSKVFLGLRLLLGVFISVFGLNKFLNFMPAFDLSPDGATYFNALITAKTLTLVGIVEITAGLAFIFNKYGALMALILMSVSVNAVLFHVVLEPSSIPGALVLFTLNSLVIYGYKAKYSALLS